MMVCLPFISKLCILLVRYISDWNQNRVFFDLSLSVFTFVNKRGNAAKNHRKRAKEKMVKKLEE
jgi:hypothetical protein